MIRIIEPRLKNISGFWMVVIILFLNSYAIGQAQVLPSNIALLISKSNKSLVAKDTIKALEWGKQAFNLADNEDDFAKVSTRMQLAKVYKANTNYSASYKNYWYAYSIANNQNYYFQSIEALYGLGNLFEGLKVWSKALGFYELANPLLAKTGENKYSVALSLGLAKCNFELKKYDQALYHYNQLNLFAIGSNNEVDGIYVNRRISDCYVAKSNFPAAIKNELSLVDVLANSNNMKELANSYHRIGIWNQRINNDQQAIDYFQQQEKADKDSDSMNVVIQYRKADSYLSLRQYDRSADLLNSLLHDKIIRNYDYWYAKSLNLFVLNFIFQENYSEALLRSDSILNHINQFEDIDLRIMLCQTIITVYDKNGNTEKALEFSKNLSALYRQREEIMLKKSELNNQALEKISLKEKQLQLQNIEEKVKEVEIKNLRIQKEQLKQKQELFQANSEKKQLAQQNKIIEEHAKVEQLNARNILLEAERMEAISQKIINEEALNSAKAKAQLDQQSQLRFIAEEKNKRLVQNRKYLAAIMLAGIIIFILVLWGFLSNKKLNKQLETQNVQLENRRLETETALEKLKAAQDQLIESERLASLGQLTAGIAHEIRNPLNFVNNFSSLIIELLDEVEDILKDIGIQDSELKTDLLEVLQLIADNNSKVNKHGIRAAHIISQMLDTASGAVSTIETTDINQLIMDSSRLAYQGVRGQNPDFISELVFDLDSDIKDQNVIHQDLGRVIINIVNNSCQSLEEKMLSIPNFKGHILVTTNNFDENFKIIIEDNGLGMNKSIVNKIFNPFFTTKPAGRGTGLGLTMTYDIITKMHHGKIEVDSEEGANCRFIIEIPKNLKQISDAV